MLYNFLLKKSRSLTNFINSLIVLARLDFFVNAVLGNAFNDYFSKIFIFYFFFIKHFLLTAINYRFVALGVSSFSRITAFSLAEFSSIIFIFIFFVDALLLTVLIIITFVLFRIFKN
jgi:hypothetical protein